MIKKPLLASTCQLDKIQYPVFASPKLDGIRCLIINGQPVSRKLKPIPNTHIREQLSKLSHTFDGEIMIPGCTFNQMQSKVMSFDGEPYFEYNVFDYINDDLDEPYIKRLEKLSTIAWDLYDNFKVNIVPVVSCSSEDELIKYENECIAAGYEGIMIRKYDGRYKEGRSTVKEAILLKLKRFKDSEATVIDFVEKMTNTNVQEKDEMGYAKRSSAKDGMIPADTLGSLTVKETLDNGGEILFNIGSGFNDEQRKEIWNNKEQYIGKFVKYKYQEFGKDAPRFPVFLGFRHTDDIGGE